MRAWPQLTMRVVPLLAGLAAPLAAQETTAVTELAPIEVTSPRIETTVPPPVATVEVSADRGHVTQDRRSAADLAQLPQAVGQRDDDKQQHADERDHAPHGRAHRYR